jgi:predicted transcriptional regulator
VSEAGKELLNRMLGSEVKAELLTLFHQNPGLIDSIDGVARRIGRSREEVAEEIEDFVEMGLLKRTKAGKANLVSLNKAKDEEFQASLADYLRRRAE